MITECSICGYQLTDSLKVKAVPPIQNRFFPDRESARHSVLTNVEFSWCNRCQHFSIIKDRSEVFDPHYNNEPTHGSVAESHLNIIIAKAEKLLPDRKSRIMEIGCGRGELISRLHAKGYTNIVGYDPSSSTDLGGLIIREYWDGSRQKAGDVCDLIILRHTIEEIPDISGFMKQVSYAVKANAMLYCEITDASHLYDTSNIFSLYPEYRNIFSLYSLSVLLSRYGLYVEKVHSFFDGEWLGVWARKRGEQNQDFSVNDRAIFARISSLIREMPRPVVLWGAGGRGGNLLSFCQLGLDVIAHVVDMNPAKVGLFMPPFGQEIVSVDQLASLRPGTVLLASGKYEQEVRSMMPDGCGLVCLDKLMTDVSS